MKKHLFYFCCGLSLIAFSSVCQAILFVPTKERSFLQVTIYNQGRALIKDTRKVNLNEGKNEIAFEDVSAQIMPQTALLEGDGVATLEQNFNFDVLSEQSLLEKSVGSVVNVEYVNPATGTVSQEKATLLSYTHGRPVLKIGSKIESSYPGRIIFDQVPAGLFAKPTLTMQVVSQKAKESLLSLNYLTTGISWKADYVALMSADETTLSLDGWVTLTNTSGVDYKNASLDLVAGAVNVVHHENVRAKGVMLNSAAVYEGSDSMPMVESLSDFYIYHIPFKTDILAQQTKQVALLSADKIGVQKTYTFRLTDIWYDGYQMGEQKDLKPNISFTFNNEKQNGLGIALPKGVVRVYKADQKANALFIGEDSIEHTAPLQTVSLKTGKAFDLTADFKCLEFKRDKDQRTASFEVVVKNGSKEEKTVQLVQNLPQSVKFLTQSVLAEKKTAQQYMWQLKVPPMGRQTLTYQIMWFTN